MKILMYKKTLAAIFAIIALSLCGCKKYLAEKSDRKLEIPSTIADLQALLDNFSVVNTGNPSSGEVSADDYYLTDNDWNALTYDYDRRKYTWQPDHLFATGSTGNDWELCYNAVYYANVVLNGLQGIGHDASNQAAWNNAKGEALVFRANRFWGALQVWSLAYDPASSETDMGIPLRLDPDFNLPSVRSSQAVCYAQITGDLKQAVPLLPVTPLSPYRPSKAAAYGLLARTYLSMRDYIQAGLYADSCLQQNNQLLDFNTLNVGSSYPITKLNKETSFYISVSSTDPLTISRAKIVSDLYQSYAADDLRRALYFKTNADNTVSFRGNYSGGSGLFCGIATDEMYLIRAECYARQSKVTEAMSDLNTLLLSRWKKGSYIPFTANNSADALSLILSERRKELLMRGLRWTDIKRLNKEVANIELSRMVNGQTYNLPANDLKYALPIPEDVIALSGIQQNPR